MPGSGKSTKLIDIANSDDVILCFTNKACDNLRRKAKVRNKGDLKIHTFESYFNPEVRGIRESVKLMKNKRILVDEFCMAPNKFMTILYMGWLAYDIEIHLFGDNKQCDPVDEVVYDYLNSVSIRDMCPNSIELEYQGHRYDEKTYEELVKFDETGVVCEIPLIDEMYDKKHMLLQ